MDIVGKTKIAHRCQVSIAAVQQWSKKADWPNPRGHISLSTGGPGSTPYWFWDEDIQPFLDRNPQLGNQQ